MKIKFRNVEEEVAEVVERGNVIVTDSNDVLLVVDNEYNFSVFDLETNGLYCYGNQDEFEEEYTIEEVYESNKVEVILNK